MRTRAFRRSCADRAKAKARGSLMGYGLDDNDIGKLASCHCKPCSCYMCGNPRKYFGSVTLREKRAILNMNAE